MAKILPNDSSFQATPGKSLNAGLGRAVQEHSTLQYSHHRDATDPSGPKNTERVKGSKMTKKY